MQHQLTIAELKVSLNQELTKLIDGRKSGGVKDRLTDLKIALNKKTEDTSKSYSEYLAELEEACKKVDFLKTTIAKSSQKSWPVIQKHLDEVKRLINIEIAKKKKLEKEQLLKAQALRLANEQKETVIVTPASVKELVVEVSETSNTESICSNETPNDAVVIDKDQKHKIEFSAPEAKDSLQAKIIDSPVPSEKVAEIYNTSEESLVEQEDTEKEDKNEALRIQGKNAAIADALDMYARQLKKDNWVPECLRCIFNTKSYKESELQILANQIRFSTSDDAEIQVGKKRQDSKLISGFFFHHRVRNLFDNIIAGDVANYISEPRLKKQ